MHIAVEALRKSEERAAAGQLALELMHEIRNPLEAFGNLLFLAYGDANNPEKVRTYIRMAEEQSATLNQIVERTLGFARSSPHPKPSDLVAVAHAAVRIHQRAIDEKKIHLVKDFPQVEFIAEVHATEILQVLSNVLVNAIDALPSEGVICLRLRKRQNGIHIVIADNGHGIPAEHRKKIFKSFFTTKKDRGTGLGLSLSKKIVERHRGKICMRSSVRPGKSGTTFKISLPA
ncbi:MAG: HAMP domain-containing histidine kinase [Acidobacteriota bacterium]|nr:HAMP domain-containing histidine kinase [Acidobacteriota bacterium]